MKNVPVLLLCCLLALASCATVENSMYRSSAPEIRGERAISSSIELVSEVTLDQSVLGIFYSREVFQDGSAQNVLFTRRSPAGFSSKAAGTIVDYDLSEISSLSVAQARKLLDAIDTYIGTDPKSLTPSQMVNFELYSGTLDMTAGSEKYRPFKEVTFIVVCSVTSAKRSFRTVFPGTIADMTGRRMTVYSTFDLTDEQVQSLRKGISEALGKSTPVTPAGAGSDAPA